MVASANGHYEVIKLLFDWKADPNIKSKEGRTALSFAKSDAIIALFHHYLLEQKRAQEDTASLYSFVSILDGSFKSNTLGSTLSIRSIPSVSSFGW